MALSRRRSCLAVVIINNIHPRDGALAWLFWFSFGHTKENGEEILPNAQDDNSEEREV